MIIILKLYFRLQNQTGVNLDLLNIPDHVVPASFYQIHLPGLSTEGSQHSIGKRSSGIRIRITFDPRVRIYQIWIDTCSLIDDGKTLKNQKPFVRGTYYAKY